MMGADHLRKVAGYDFHDLRRKYDVRTMWGDLDPQWRLLQSQLVARGPGWYSPADLKERLFTNKSKRPGDDLKEALRTDDDTVAWQAWNVAHDLIWQSCRPGPPLVFPGEKELIRAMYDQIGKEEQIISPPYARTPLVKIYKSRYLHEWFSSMMKAMGCRSIHTRHLPRAPSGNSGTLPIQSMVRYHSPWGSKTCSIGRQQLSRWINTKGKLSVKSWR